MPFSNWSPTFLTPFLPNQDLFNSWFLNVTKMKQGFSEKWLIMDLRQKKYNPCKILLCQKRKN